MQTSDTIITQFKTFKSSLKKFVHQNTAPWCWNYFPVVLQKYLVSRWVRWENPLISMSLWSLPYAVEDITAREDPDIQVGGQDGVEATYLLISEECVRHPHFAGFCHCQVTDFIWTVNTFPIWFCFSVSYFLQPPFLPVFPWISVFCHSIAGAELF